MTSIEGIEALFLHATEGILITNQAGRIININPSGEKLFGYENGELIGQQLEVLIPKRLKERHKQHRTVYSENPNPRAMGKEMELFGTHKNGSEIPVEISLSPYSNVDGNFVIAFIVEISLRKMAEERLRNYSFELEKQVKNRTLILEEAIAELEKTKLELHEALEKERELNELKSRFVSMASHEFRTPLATILSSLSLVKKYGEISEKEKQSKHITRIKTAITDLTDILNDFLSVSKLEEGKVECYFERFNIQEHTLEVVTEMQQLAKTGQQIIYEHCGETNAYLDKKLVKNIYFNLISNAIKFSGEQNSIEIQTISNEKELKIIVKDQGVGIPKEDQKHLFQRFFRGKNVINIQGTGLGLNIVAQFTELMNGYIIFESQENIGTSFTLTFPK